MTSRPTVVPIVHAGASPHAPLTRDQIATNLRPAASGVHTTKRTVH